MTDDVASSREFLIFIIPSFTISFFFVVPKGRHRARARRDGGRAELPAPKDGRNHQPLGLRRVRAAGNTEGNCPLRIL